MLTVKDPDGNRIVFVDIDAAMSRRLLQMPKLPKLPKLSWPGSP
jgi:hypothetical protein